MMTTEKKLRRSLRKMLDHYDRNTCRHEETHRGGVLWTICDGCGEEWADDRGGFKPYEEPEFVSEARALLRRPRGEA